MPTALRDLRGFMLDLDGVVYTGQQVIPGAREFFAWLRQSSARFLLITNNSSRGPEQFALRLGRMGIHVAPVEILTSAEATGEFLVGNAPAASRVFVIGEQGLHSALEARGFQLVDDEDAAYVVVGLDRQFDYRKLTIAIRAVLNGAHFIGSNPDVTLPDAAGILPGAGSVQAAIRAATGVEPTIIGKPEPTMLSYGLRRLGCAPHEVAVIGDRLDTDIIGGRRAGLVTILVLTGISSEDDLTRSSVQPDYVVRDLFALVRMLGPATAKRSARAR